MLTKRCLEILVENRRPFTVQAKSSLVLRDIEILKRSKDRCKADMREPEEEIDSHLSENNPEG